MGKCKIKLMDGKPCGIESNDILCRFHRYRPFMREHQGHLRQYAEENMRESLDLSDMVFEGVEFSSTTLPTEKPLVFDGSKFNDCVFRHLDIRTRLSFKMCSLNNTSFDWVQFHGESVDFSMATISATDVVFRSCTFEAALHISFTRTVIKCRHSPFVRTYMRAQQITFLECSLDTDRFNILATGLDGERPDHAYLALESPTVFFIGLKLTGHFEYRNHHECLYYDPIVLFSSVNFSQMKTATFVEANLERVHFTYSKLDNVHFIMPLWPKKNGRWIIYDELEPANETSDRHIKDTYVQLKRNYEDSRKYSEAGEWFYREMECRRRLVDADSDSNWFVRGLSRFLFRAYKLVSDYGENLLKPFGWIIGLFVLWGLLYFYWGFDIGSGPVSYDFVCDVTWESAEDFANALFYSFGIMSFQLTKTAFQHGIASSILAVSQILLTLILVPLFLLALRRKFRR